MKYLTERQRDILQFIREFQRERDGLSLDVLEESSRRRYDDFSCSSHRGRFARRAPLDQEVLGENHRRAGAQNRGALYHVLQLSDVSRPGMALQSLHACIGNAQNFDPMFAREALPELIGQQSYVFLVLAQRRHADWHHI